MAPAENELSHGPCRKDAELEDRAVSGRRLESHYPRVIHGRRLNGENGRWLAARSRHVEQVRAFEAGSAELDLASQPEVAEPPHTEERAEELRLAVDCYVESGRLVVSPAENVPATGHAIQRRPEIVGIPIRGARRIV
jgi:hypothetical protein